MRCSFVTTISLLLGIDDVSSQHCYSCDVLSSSRITRLHWYYDVIRLPLHHLPFSLYYQLSGILAFQQERRGPPGLPHIRYVRHAMVSDPGEVPVTCHSPLNMLTSVTSTTSSLSTDLSRLNPFNLMAYGLSSRCPTLNLRDYSPRSKDSLPGGGQPSGAGFAPAKICDLARPHRYSSCKITQQVINIICDYNLYAITGKFDY